MLWNFVLSPRLFEGPGASGDDAVDLLQILRSIRERVTLVAPEEDLAEIQLKLIDRTASKRMGEQASALLEQELAESGPGLIRVPCGRYRTPAARARAAAEALGVRTVLIGNSDDLPSELRGLSPKTIFEAARDLDHEQPSKNLLSFGSEQQLMSFIERLFWRAAPIAIVDPYLGRKAIERRDEDAELALQFILRCATRAQGMTQRPTSLIIVTDKRKLHPGGVNLEEVIERAKTRLQQIAASSEIVVAFVESFTIRGMVTSGRVWQIEHETDDLARAIQRLRGAPARSRANDPFIKLADEETSRQVRGLVKRALAAARPIASNSA